MHTNQITTPGTGPPVLFGANEMAHAEFPDALKIVKHAYAILGSIALIQVCQTGTGKAGATEAVLDSALHDVLTVLDAARNAGLRFMIVVTPAARTGLLISPISMTEVAVHATGGDQRGANRMGLDRASRRYICISFFSQPLSPLVILRMIGR
jgi:hypothetical protein